MKIPNKQCIICDEDDEELRALKCPIYNVFVIQYFCWYPVKTGGTFRGLFSGVLL
jgi:hypothetical protein